MRQAHKQKDSWHAIGDTRDDDLPKLLLLPSARERVRSNRNRAPWAPGYGDDDDKNEMRRDETRQKKKLVRWGNLDPFPSHAGDTT